MQCMQRAILAHIGCCIGGMLCNLLAYADDIVLLAPSWRGLQHLICVLERRSASIDLTCNREKTVCMTFSPKQRGKMIAGCFPQFSHGTKALQFVKELKFLGGSYCSAPPLIGGGIKRRFSLTSVCLSVCRIYRA